MECLKRRAADLLMYQIYTIFFPLKDSLFENPLKKMSGLKRKGPKKERFIAFLQLQFLREREKKPSGYILVPPFFLL